MNRQFVPTGFSFAIVAALASALGLVVIRPAILMRAASAQQKAGVKSAARAPKDYVPVAQYCVAASFDGAAICVKPQ